MAQQEYKNEILGKNQGSFNETKYYGGSVNTEIHRHYENNFRMKLGEPQDTSFNIRGSRPRETPWNNPYEIGLPTNDGSVEIDLRNFPKDNAEPVFKNKIEEAIYRAKRK